MGNQALIIYVYTWVMYYGVVEYLTEIIPDIWHTVHHYEWFIVKDWNFKYMFIKVSH